MGRGFLPDDHPLCFNAARNRKLSFAYQQQDAIGLEEKNTKRRVTQERETSLTMREATLQVRAAKLSPSKQGTLTIKRNQFLAPSST